MVVPSAKALASRVSLRWRALAAILILAGLLGALVESRARILRAGTEIRLRTVPVDPRDLFRGDYVILNYQIGTIDAAIRDRSTRFRRGESVFVTLGRDSDGFAAVSAVSRERPAAAEGKVIIAGRVTSTDSCGMNAQGEIDCAAGRGALRVTYGLESYFIPEGTGRPIETTDRKRLEIVAAVADSGEAAIKRLLIDGKLVHAEPPY